MRRKGGIRSKNNGRGRPRAKPSSSFHPACMVVLAVSLDDVVAARADEQEATDILRGETAVGVMGEEGAHEVEQRFLHCELGSIAVVGRPRIRVEEVTTDFASTQSLTELRLGHPGSEVVTKAEQYVSIGRRWSLRVI